MVAEDRSNHWKALSMFAKAKRPSELRSCSRLFRASCGITRDMNDELLFTMLVFGFRLFVPSFPTGGDNSMLPSPKTGLFPYVLARDACAGSPSLPVSSDLRGSFSLSLMLWVAKNDLAVDDVVTLCNGWAALRGLAVTRESLTPAVGGAGVVARGFGLVVGASEG